MKLNIIHLPHRIDRWMLLQQELSAQNIVDFDIWEGIMDDEGPHVGISRAHKQIVKYALERNWSEVLIGEDDLRFTAEGAFDFFISKKPSDFDIYLGGIYCGNIKGDNSVD